MFEVLGEEKLGVTDGGIDVGEQEIQGQGVEEGHVDGRDAVADTVGVLVKLHVTGAVEFVFDGPVPANAGGEVGGRAVTQAGEVVARLLRGGVRAHHGFDDDHTARRPGPNDGPARGGVHAGLPAQRAAVAALVMAVGRPGGRGVGGV